jgi:hypothetical protein
MGLSYGTPAFTGASNSVAPQHATNNLRIKGLGAHFDPGHPLGWGVNRKGGSQLADSIAGV